MPSLQLPSREAADAILAKNLMVARVIAGITQHALASAADISRATIAQLETGYSDPRLSTIVDLANALGISPIVLLLGNAEARALVALPSQVQRDSLLVPSDKLEQMRRYVLTGMLKDRVRAARVGADLSGETGGAAVVAAVMSAIIPGAGTEIGTALGKLMLERI